MTLFDKVDSVVYNVLGTSPKTVGNQVKSVSDVPTNVQRMGAKQTASTMGQNIIKDSERPADDLGKNLGTAGKMAGDLITMPQQSVAGLTDFGLRASTGQARQSDAYVQPLNALGVADTGAITGLMKSSKGVTTGSHATLAGVASACVPTVSKVAHNVAHIQSFGQGNIRNRSRWLAEDRKSNKGSGCVIC